jgi:hypothetical protein
VTETEDRFRIGKEFEKLTASMRGGFSFLKDELNDTTLVMMATSLIDEYMKFVLIVGFGPETRSKKLLEKVFEGYGPLATFSSKISLCEALNLFIADDIRHDLGILRKIRNEFAHSPRERHLNEFPQCKSLKIMSGAKIDDQIEERRCFKRSCAGIIPTLGIMAAIRVTEHSYLARNRQAVADEATASINAMLAGKTPTPRQ